MPNRASAHRGVRLDGVFLRAIGGLAVAGYELRAARPENDQPGTQGWTDFADQLLECIDAVLEGAATSSFRGNTIAILRGGARVSVDSLYVDRLTEKVARHTQIGLMIGLDGNVGEELMAVGA